MMVAFAILAAALLSQLELLLRQGAEAPLAPGALAALNALYTMKFLIPFALAAMAVFVLLSEKGHQHQVKSEMVPLLYQIKCLREGHYTKKRPMRKHDVLKPVMKALHQLSDELDQSRPRATLETPAQDRRDRAAQPG